ncbi:site-specific recombinase XerD [Bradyrhizobium sp. GM7.3]
MPAATHLYRRKAMYYWRRRLPNALASWFHRRHLFLSLQTPDPNFARRLVVLLDAKLEEVVTAFEHSEMHLTPPQVDGLLRDVVTKHLNKLERLSAAAKSFAGFDPAQAERDDRRAAWAYRLLHTQGSNAVVRPTDETQMSAEGLTAADIAAVQDHLAMLRVNDLVPTRHGILQNLLAANGAPANASNLALAQDVYFRGMWMALAQSERRYGGKIVEAGDFVDQILKDRVRPVSGNFEMPVERIQQPQMSPPYQVEDSPVQEEPDAVDDRFKTMADLLLRKRSKAERWTAKSKQQATQIFSLLTRFMKEERSLENMSAVKQKDLAALASFLETEIYKHHGKSKNDKNRSISEMRIIALSKPEDLRGLEAGTLNRHLTFIDQLFDLAEAEGVDLDPKLKITKLRAIDSTDERERDERLKLPLSKIKDLFAQPPFVNCAGWDRQSKEGAAGKSLVFHGALYFIPMMTFYGGGRREEYCGLMTDDVIEGNGEHPYLRIAKNKFRRIKNGQSKRNIVIHPELIRLGFLQYVALIRSLGYELVFPDLFSPTTKSPLGNRYYKLFKPVLIAAGITEEGLGSHALRHAFGAILKKKEVREELRADLLGHSGKSETSERYSEATEIAAMYKLVCKMPTVTGHLIAHPINLPSWVSDKKPPPFSHPTRARHSR